MLGRRQTITAADLTQLQYTKCVIKEALRSLSLLLAVRFTDLFQPARSGLAHGVIISASESRLKGRRVRLSAVLLSGNNLRQVVHTHVFSASKQYKLVPVKRR